MGDNGIVDISSLASLTSLSSLRLSNNLIADFSPISGMTQLFSFFAENCEIEDLGFLSRLTNLGILGLQQNRIIDVSPISQMTELYALYLDGNLIEDIGPLSVLTRVQFLTLNENRISDISPISNLTPTYLHLAANRITDLRAFPGNARFSDTGSGSAIDLRGNPLSPESLASYIPQIQVNNPNATILYYEEGFVGPLYVNGPFPGDPLARDNPGGSNDLPFGEIAQAIRWSIDGVTIVVRAGTYSEAINFDGRSIMVTTNDPATPDAIGYSATIDVGAAGSPIMFFDGANSVLDGFIISNATGPLASAILCEGSSAVVSNCLIVGNQATEPSGAAIRILSDSNFNLVNSAVADNLGTAIWIADSNVAVVNSILWNNSLGEIVVETGVDPNVQYSTVQGGLTYGKEIDTADPVFASPGYWVDPETRNATWIPESTTFYQTWVFGISMAMERWMAKTLP